MMNLEAFEALAVLASWTSFEIQLLFVYIRLAKTIVWDACMLAGSFRKGTESRRRVGAALGASRMKARLLCCLDIVPLITCVESRILSPHTIFRTRDFVFSESI